MSSRTAAGVVAIAVDGGGELTFGAWEERSNALARGLAGRGVAPGDRVGLLFEAAAWPDFAVAHRGVVKAGATPVLLSPGATLPEVARALSRSGAVGLLCSSPRDVPVWAASPDEVGWAYGTEPVAADPVGPAPEPEVEVEVDGWLVHAWAPGSAGGLLALGARHGAATLATFEPHRLCALAEERRATVLGLTPALAAALLAVGAPDGRDLSSVRQVILSGPCTPALRSALEATFPAASVTTLSAPPAAAGGAPVAVSQEPMLWHEQFVPGSFNLPCLVRRYRGPLDVAALEWALSALVDRHEPLRSTFVLGDGEPRQVVGRTGLRALPVTDLGGLPPEDRDVETATLLADASSRPFDLTTGLLFEPRLVRFGAEDHVLVIRVHHTVFDDWSVDLFRRELSALYSARVGGEPSPLAPLSISFSEACRRQRSRLAGPVEAEERAWWRRELEGAPLAVQLPIGPGGTGEPLRLELPHQLAAEVRAVAPRLRATPYMTVLAAFSVLLARLTGQEDLVISTVVANRNRSDLEPLVGCFTKKVPLRLRVDGTPTFAELVARTRASLLGSVSHQALGFDAALHEGLGEPAAAHGVVPQVAVVFQAETPQKVRLTLPGLVVGPYEVPAEARRERHFSAGPEGREAPAWGDGIYLGTFLILSLAELEGGMALIARGVFDRPPVRRLLDDLQSLLAAMVADPSTRVGAVARPVEDEVLDLRGFRARRSRLEGALATCPGVASVSLAVGNARLVAGVVPDGGPPPTLTGLRQALWAALPGAPWPASATGVAADVPDPLAAMLAAMWRETSGKAVTVDTSYWQDFSFLATLAEARAAGLAVTDEHVVRARTPRMLAAAMTAGRG